MGYKVTGTIGGFFPEKDPYAADTNEIIYVGANGQQYTCTHVYFYNPKATTEADKLILFWKREEDTPTHTWRLITAAKDQSCPSVLVNLDQCKITGFTVYHSNKILSVSDIIAEYRGEFTTSNVDNSLCYTHNTTSEFSLVSSTLMDEKTVDGEDIYKTVVKTNDTDGIVLLDYKYLFFLNHKIDDYNLCSSVGYTEEDTNIARWQYLWPVKDTVGEQWQGDTGSNGVVDGFIKIEFATKPIFDTDPIPDSTITPYYDIGGNFVSWTIIKDGVDVNTPVYVDRYLTYFNGEYYRSGTIDCTNIDSGTYPISIRVTSVEGNQKDYSGAVTVLKDINNYTSMKLSGQETCYVKYVPTQNERIVSWVYPTTRTVYHDAWTEILDENFNKISGITYLASVFEVYPKKTVDGETLRKVKLTVDKKDEHEFILTAGTTYYFSIANSTADWGIMAPDIVSTDAAIYSHPAYYKSSWESVWHETTAAVIFFTEPVNEE